MSSTVSSLSSSSSAAIISTYPPLATKSVNYPLPTTCAETYRCHTREVTSVCISIDNRIISGSEDGTIKLQELTIPPGIAEGLPNVNSFDRILGMNMNYQFLLAGVSNDDCIIYWDLKLHNGPGTIGIKDPNKHTRPVTAVVGLLDSSKMVSGSSDHTIKMWSTKYNHLEWTGTHNGPVNTVTAFRHKKIIISGSDDKTINFWNENGGHPLKPVFHDGPVYALAVNPDESLLASGSGDKTVRIWDLLLDDPLYRKFDTPSEVYALTIFPDGSIASGHMNGDIWIWDSSLSGSCYRLQGDVHRGCVRSLAVAPDGTLVSGSEDGTIKWWK